MVDLGWKSVGVLELTALPSIDRQRWVHWVRDADALLVNGGDTVFLAHWMRKCELFSIFPHLDNPEFPHQSMAAAERWAAEVPGPAYAIDDATAIKVADCRVEVVSEGNWKLFTAPTWNVGGLPTSSASSTRTDARRPSSN
jgi:dipeptidase E